MMFRLIQNIFTNFVNILLETENAEHVNHIFANIN